MSTEERNALKQETRDIFYHGFDNYMKHAFPEDELRPVSCQPLTRDRQNPAHIEVNDVLGNYSLTLIDSLSTLAILASSPPKKQQTRALSQFQDGIKNLVEMYGDGSSGAGGQGKRARGFDLDSKVQVFETVIRGVGGLLSAHQFAVGDLPVTGYAPLEQTKKGKTGLHWKNGLVYDGQLLRLAQDLADRLLPAFLTPTGLPYPRVNLRHGVPFYANSPLNIDPENGQCMTRAQSQAEITETCSAGAGSLVLEFSTLSRLTGNPKYEDAAKKAFWSVWSHRSSIGLIGSGIDAETGNWVHGTTGIGAGIDSFFEYAFKSHVLLSGLPHNVSEQSTNSADDFLSVWQDAHAAIKHHVYRGPTFQHPHYLQVDLYTGALRAFWVDSLSAYYPGLLALAGELDEAISAHLLYTAIWTRYSALPERWSTATGGIEAGLRWWIGRPEFIESNWYIYRATKDPWYLHVAEMALRDIKRRCWTKCGWAGLQDVRSGELMDRQESFFLGETAKYLFLTFDEDHPLNHLDAPFVLTTEGHPLIIPNRLRTETSQDDHAVMNLFVTPAGPVCAAPPPVHPLTISSTAAREDVFHAASLARLHLMPTIETLESPLVEFTADHPSITPSDLHSPSNYTFYPWTLPLDLVPPNGNCSIMASRTTFDLSFPNIPDSASGFGALQRVYDGILVNSMSGLRLGMVKENLPPAMVPEKIPELDLFRIYAISNVALGRDEKVFLTRNLLSAFNPGDPYFSRIKDLQIVDLVLDIANGPSQTPETAVEKRNASMTTPLITLDGSLADLGEGLHTGLLSSLLNNIQSILSDNAESHSMPEQQVIQMPPALVREAIPAALPSGPGAAILPELPEPDLSNNAITSPLPWKNVFVLDSELCDYVLDPAIVRENQVLVIRRGGCSFSQKLRNIPSFAPTSQSLQIVIVVSFPEHDAVDADLRRQRGEELHEGEVELMQPFLDVEQVTPGGVVRMNAIPLVKVLGGEETMERFKRAEGVGVRRRWWFESQGTRIGNLFVV